MQVDLLLKNAIVLTMDESYNIYDRGAVAVQGDHIVEAGDEALMLDKYEAAQVIDCGGKVLMPGMVNTHTHVPMSLLRGQPTTVVSTFG